MRRRAILGASAVVVAGLVAAACGDDSKAADTTTKATTAGGATTAAGGVTTAAGTTVARTASDVGVSVDSIDIGFVVSVTGAAGANNTNMIKSAKARVQLENDNGGVNGRKINLIDTDNGSDATRDTAVTQQLIESKKVFALIANNPFTFASFRYLTDKKIPTISGGYDGSPYGSPGAETLFPLSMSLPTWSYDTIPQYVKARGATKVASVGYGQSPSSTAAAKNFADAAKGIGLDAPYVNTSLAFGTTDVAPIGLAMKNANIDGGYLPMDNNTNFAIVTAAKQSGVAFKAIVSATGYGQALLDQPTALAAAEGAYFSTGWQPAESGGAAVKAMMDALKKYANYTGVPDFSEYEGWISADLMIQGLKAAGPNPTQASLLAGIRSITAYDASGLMPQKSDYSAASYGKQPDQSCGFFVKVSGGKYVPDPAPDGKFCGKKVNA